MLNQEFECFDLTRLFRHTLVCSPRETAWPQCDCSSQHLADLMPVIHRLDYYGEAILGLGARSPCRQLFLEQMLCCIIGVGIVNLLLEGHCNIVMKNQSELDVRFWERGWIQPTFSDIIKRKLASSGCWSLLNHRRERSQADSRWTPPISTAGKHSSLVASLFVSILW